VTYKVLVATDGSDNSLRAAEFAAGLASLVPGIQVTVLMVNDMLEKMKYYSPLRTPVIFEEVESFFKDKSQEALNRTMGPFDRRKYQVEGIMKVGNPVQEIVTLSKEGGYNQIIIGSRGMGGLKGLFLGSVSSKVVQLATCPVTIVK